MDNRPLQRLVFDLIEDTVADYNFELVAVELLTVEGRRTMRISIESTGNMGANALASVSHAVSALLDVEDPVDGAYDLEMSSPGIERPLQRLSDFVRFAGYSVKLRLQPGEERRRYTGVLRGLRDGLVLLEVDGQDVELDFSLVERARLDLTLDEYIQLGKAPPPRIADQEIENAQ
jgi:ribosome maturation factor RimP